MVAEFIYSLCALTSAACALLLYRGYRTSHTRLLFWSSVCFVGLAVNNLVLLADVVIAPTVELYLGLRTAIAALSVGALLYGLIWEVR